MKKGAMEQSTLISIILVVVFLVGAVVFFSRLYDFSDDQAKEMTCRTSIITNANIKVAEKSFFPVRCQRRFLYVDSEGYKVYYADAKQKSIEKIPYYKQFGKKTDLEDAFYEIMAEEWATCWFKFGEGRINVFNKEAKTNHVCAVCSQIMLSDELAGQNLGTREGLWEYMQRHNFTKFEINENYREFLIDSMIYENKIDYEGRGTAKEVFDVFFMPGAPISQLSSQKEYIVGFSATKNGWAADASSQAGQGYMRSDPIFSLIALYKDYSQSQAMFEPPQNVYFSIVENKMDIADRCDMVIN